MKIIRENNVYAMSKDNEAVMECNIGDTVVFETFDCFENQIKSNKDTIDTLDFDRVNPATGPLYIKGANVGDILKVTIKEINIKDKYVAMTGNGLGVMGEVLEDYEIVVGDITDSHVIFEGYSIELNKMVGVIGVAPKEEEVSCGTPDYHGGNMDTKDIKEGASVYFEVYHPGGLLSIGDLHACMGDGEVGVSGAEVNGEVVVEIDVIKDFKVKTPLVVVDSCVNFIASKTTLDSAVSVATNNAADCLSEYSSLTLAKSSILLSLAGNLKIGQVVDPKKTARMQIGLEYFNEEFKKKLKV